MSTSSVHRNIAKWKRPLLGGIISALLAGFCLRHIYVNPGDTSSIVTLLGALFFLPEVIIDRLFILTPETTVRLFPVLLFLTSLFWFLVGFVIVHVTKKVVYALVLWFLLLVAPAFVLVGPLTKYEQDPEFMFKRLLSNPIPEGISSIQMYDDFFGSADKYFLKFEATPRAIDTLISRNEFILNSNTDYSTAPCDLFPELDCEQTWINYTKSSAEHGLYWSLWVNSERSTIWFEFQQEYPELSSSTPTPTREELNSQYSALTATEPIPATATNQPSPAPTEPENSECNRLKLTSQECANSEQSVFTLSGFVDGYCWYGYSDSTVTRDLVMTVSFSSDDLGKKVTIKNGTHLECVASLTSYNTYSYDCSVHSNHQTGVITFLDDGFNNEGGFTNSANKNCTWSESYKFR